MRSPARAACREKNMHNTTTAITTSAPGPLALKGYDPELLYVECGRCGSPVM